MIHSKKVIDLVKNLAKQRVLDVEAIEIAKRKLAKGIANNLLTNNYIFSIYRDLVKEKKIKPNLRLAEFLRIRRIRTLSGVTPITVLMKPYACPGKCIYCPLEPDMPKSYLSNEPAAMRAVANKFDAKMQVKKRIEALEANGHVVDKIELIVLGGSFTAYPKNYQYQFIKDCFDAANGYGRDAKHRVSTLIESQKMNEKAKYRIIGLTLETRPDLINGKVIANLRELGCTRVQLGVQAIDDKILKLNKRGHGVDAIIRATSLLKQAGFKVDYHIMPNLYGSTPAKDVKMFKEIFFNPDFQPDQIKIYPCVVSEYAELYQWYKKGKYKSYSARQLFELLLKMKELTPPWVRINRLIRDIPKESIISGNDITNLREALQSELKKRSKSCQCLRCREVRGESLESGKEKLCVYKYPASGGEEVFLSFEDKEQKKVYAFLRLRLPAKDQAKNPVLPELRDCALIRELHTYGQLTSVGSKGKKIQHRGLGRQLMIEAENIIKKNGFKKMAVIAGIGVRDYYRKLGYKLGGSYMVKNMVQQPRNKIQDTRYKIQDTRYKLTSKDFLFFVSCILVLPMVWTKEFKVL